MIDAIWGLWTEVLSKDVDILGVVQTRHVRPNKYRRANEPLLAEFVSRSGPELIVDPDADHVFVEFNGVIGGHFSR
jgi:hypothetical protein